MSAYGMFAQFYDTLLREEGFDYSFLADHLLRVFREYAGKEPQTMLDLACGTGSLALQLYHRGKDMIAVDGSPEMLAIAQEKCFREQADILFVCQELSELDLYGTVQGAVCTLDSINHLIVQADLEAFFKRLYCFLEPGSFFLFDCNTRYKQETVLADNCFVLETDQLFCVWQNSYDAQTQLTEIELDFFVQEAPFYRRYRETFAERVYSPQALEGMLKAAGFCLIDILDGYTMDHPTPKCERNLLIAKRL